VAGEDNVTAGGGLFYRYRHSRHWGMEAAFDAMGGSFGNGRFERTAMPLTASLLFHLTPRGAFDLHLLGGIGWVFSEVRIENPPGHPELAVGKQNFGEFQAHLGIGAELRLGPAFGLTADLRYIGRVLSQSDDGQWYQDVDGGPVPQSSHGAQFTLGGAIHF
jgi:hypothetical protein